jgi:uncharacterized protein
MNNSFLGTGWSFPIALDEGKQIKLAHEEESIRQSIWMILDTSPGERVMRPDFGCGMHDLVFGVNDASTANAIAGAAREALGMWEPRIDVLDVYANPDPANVNVLQIEINYQVRATNSRYNLVYPFYLE